MAAVEATDCAIEGTVIWASRADGRTALAGLADTVAASGRGGMARAPAAPDVAVASSGVDLAAALAGATLGAAEAVLAAGVFVEAGNGGAFLGAGDVTLAAVFAGFAAVLTLDFLSGAALAATWVAFGAGFNGLAGTFFATAAAPLAEVFAAVLDAVLLGLATSLV